MLITSDGNEKTLHISEIGTLIIENTAVNLTAYLLCELSRYKVKVIFCDHQRNPYGEIIPYYGSHNASKQTSKQSQWSQSAKNSLWKTNFIWNLCSAAHYFSGRACTIYK